MVRNAAMASRELKMNERLETLRSVPPSTLSPKKNWIISYFFLCFVCRQLLPRRTGSERFLKTGQRKSSSAFLAFDIQLSLFETTTKNEKLFMLIIIFSLAAFIRWWEEALKYFKLPGDIIFSHPPDEEREEGESDETHLFAVQQSEKALEVFLLAFAH